MNKSGTFSVTDIQRFTTRDGPGIRTTVFMKGCNLQCQWCHNPEAMSSDRELCFHERKCVRCGACASVCEEHRFAHGFGEYVFDKTCVQCGKCAEVCPSGAIAEASKEMTIASIVKAVLRDKYFYGENGGVTISGGEPLLQKELPELLKTLRTYGIHTAVDTAMNVPWQCIEAVIPHTCLFLADIKAIDPVLHRELTGVDNARILKNIRALAQSGADFWIRVPVIPTKNTDQIEAIAAFVSSLNRPDVPVELIPYHNMAGGKYASLGKKLPLEDIEPPEKEQMDVYYRAFKGIKHVAYSEKED